MSNQSSGTGAGAGTTAPRARGTQASETPQAALTRGKRAGP
jgi:hypothetical protein